MADSKEPGWLHVRLAVAFCSAVLFGSTLLVAPLVVGMLGRGGEVLLVYGFVFSKWGAAAVLAAFVLGFVLGSARMAEFFSLMYGTHPSWKRVGDWFYEHENLGWFLMLTFIVAVTLLLFRLD